MKKLFTLIMLSIGMLVLVACQDSKTPSSNIPNPDGSTVQVFSNDDEILGFSVISAVTMLSGVNQISVDQSPLVPLSLQQEGLEVLNEIEELESYLAMINTFMGAGNGFTVNVTTSEIEEFTNRMVITITDITGDVISYEFHYNETIEWDDDDEVAYESVLEGIMIIDGVTYILYGTRSVDQEEESLELTAKIDDENYVTLIYEIETDYDELETTFEYEMFINNQLDKQIIIEFEKEEDEVSMSLFFLEGELEREYDFEIEYSDDELTIEIEYKFTFEGNTIEEGSIEITLWFDQETGTFKISYEIEVEGQDSVYIERKYDDDDEDDEDDDDEEDDDEEDTSSEL